MYIIEMKDDQITEIIKCLDVIDIVKDQCDYIKEEDPKTYVSQKTGRGPLTESWLEEYWADVKVL